MTDPTEPQDLARLKGVAEPSPDELIERVARALHIALAGGDPDELIHHPAQKSWAAPSWPRWEQWKEAAEAAIAAMPSVPDLIEDLSKSGEREAVLREALEWQPIETAPKDGTDLLLVCATAYAPRAFEGWWGWWDGAEGWQHFARPEEKLSGGVTRWFPTHWMPKPEWRPRPPTPALSPPPVGVGG